MFNSVRFYILVGISELSRSYDEVNLLGKESVFLKTRLIKLFILVVISGVLLLTGQGNYIESVNKETETFINWVNFIRLNGKDYSTIRHGVISDPKFIREKIGTVKFKVSNVVTSLDYEIKDGDAAFLEKGTEIYAIQGLSEDDYIAVKDNSKVNGYSIYYFSDIGYKWHYKDVPKDRITKVEVYESSNLIPKLIKVIDKKVDIKEFIGILDNGIVDSDFIPATVYSDKDPQRVRIIIYTGEIIGYNYVISYDGKTYYWSPWKLQILPKRIGKFVR